MLAVHFDIRTLRARLIGMLLEGTDRTTADREPALHDEAVAWLCPVRDRRSRAPG